MNTIVIKKILNDFSALLNACWDQIERLSISDTSGSFKADWQQANWELIVEGQLSFENLVLEAYGDGADCNHASSRVLYPNRLPTHKLVCRPSNGILIYDYINEKEIEVSELGITFDRFVSLGKDKWYYETAPFDKILGNYNGEDVVVDFNNVDIFLLSTKS